MSSRIAFTFLALALLAVPASASHWSLYYAGLDASPGIVREDDGAQVVAYDNPLHGQVNRVLSPGARLGDGGLFLDARVGNYVGTASTSTDIYVSAFTEPLLQRSDLLLPLNKRLSAWYGWWLDLDSDGAIQDTQDAMCGGLACAGDEFAWRGHATDEAVALVAFVVPGESFPTSSSTPWKLKVAQLGAFTNKSAFSTHIMDDDTALENGEQGWTTSMFANYDGGLLMTAFTVVAADAPPAPGSRLKFDLDDARALVDVDRYTAVSPDVEAAYLAVVADARPTLALADPDGVAPAATALVADGRSLVDDVSDAQFASVTDARAMAMGMVAHADAKEPNTVFDDFEGRASFGGVGDALGSYNGYAGYLDGHHLYFDNVARMPACAGAWATVPGSGVEASAPGETACQSSTTYLAAAAQVDPGRILGRESRSSGFGLFFEGHIFLWRDINRDGHVGTICDPEGPDFDAERNVCMNAPFPFPHARLSQEPISICSSARATDTTFTLVPLDGAWSNAVVARDIKDTTRVAFDQHWEVRNDADPITLRWRSQCESPPGGRYPPDPELFGRDAVFFPTGSATAIMVIAEVSLAGFKDVALGIDVGFERVIDVDILPAAF